MPKKVYYLINIYLVTIKYTISVIIIIEVKAIEIAREEAEREYSPNAQIVNERKKKME